MESKQQKSLSFYASNPDYFMLTAHRGASFEFPENTLLSMAKAIEAGANMIEFDVRGTNENIPVILHDQTIDRTSNGTGMPEDYSLAELKKFNFSYYLQFERRTSPIFDQMEIPTFEEILANFHHKACMNIQVYAKNNETLKNICYLFKKYEMYDYGYFTVTPDVIDEVRTIDKDIELCTTRGWDTRSNPEVLELCAKSDHCRFVQPVVKFTSELGYQLIRDYNMRSNGFFCDTPEEMVSLQAQGCQGVLTNKIHLLCQNRNLLK
jgi:glycerophosphoryl diester phosphodiesterase